MIKVLHYIPGFLYGGIESMFLSWYKNINHDEFDFELLIRTQDDEASALCEYRELGGKYYRISPISDLKLYKKSIKNFFNEHHDYDILHAHGSGPFVMRYAKKYGIKKIIFHSHATDFMHTSNFLYYIKEKIIYIDLIISKKLYVDYAFACSKKAAIWEYGSMMFKNKPVNIIHNAIESEKYEYNYSRRAQVKSTLNISNKFIVGHIGRMTYPKNQFYLLEIFKKIIEINKDSILMLVGDGPDEKELKSYAVKLGIGKEVMFLGSRDNVPDLLHVMDCFLLPSRYEGLPVTLIESQAAGLPCFVSDAITEEADLIPNLIYRYSITDKPEIWAADIVNKTKKFNRVKIKESILDSGYDIKTEVKKLEQKYKEILKS